jgi:hypothetical protein
MFLACFFSLGLAVCTAQTPSPKVKVIATVKDRAEGVAIPYAHLWMHEESKGLCLEATPDGRGGFTIELQPGYYDLLVGAPGFAPYSRRISVSFQKPLLLKIRLGAAT